LPAIGCTATRVPRGGAGARRGALRFSERALAGAALEISTHASKATRTRTARQWSLKTDPLPSIWNGLSGRIFCGARV